MTAEDSRFRKLFDLTGRTAVVTGGCGILGRDFALGLAAHGAEVAIWDLAVAEPKKVAAELAEKAGARIEGFACDLGQEADIKAAADATEKSFGKIDILISNAAAKTADLSEFFKAGEHFTPEAWREVMLINMDGSFLAMREIGSRMIARGKGGSIIQIASIYGIVAPDRRIYDGSQYLGQPIDTPPVYAASKAGVLGLMRYFAAYWAPHGIRVNAISPGGVESGQNDVFQQKYSARVPMQRMAQMGEMVGAAVFLSSDGASYVTGHNLVVDGGLSIW